MLRHVAESLHLNLSEADLESFVALLTDPFAAYDAVEGMPDYLPEVRYPREAGYRPSEDENPLSAWYMKTRVEGSGSGKLAGRTVALKDNICLAGVQMMGGASILEGYVPEVDATIVNRILDAGGTITGKAVCEYFSASGGSHTSATGPVHNPIACPDEGGATRGRAARRVASSRVRQWPGTLC